MEPNLKSPIIIKNDDNLFHIIDVDNILSYKNIKRKLNDFSPYFFDKNAMLFKADLTYIQILNVINKLNHILKKNKMPLIELDASFKVFLNNQRYFIKEQSNAGVSIKNNDSRWNDEFNSFNNIVSSEIYRPLKDEQKKAAFFLEVMKRAANFSVPGSGKTAMMYGVYAYLSSTRIKKINKILVISPINAFYSWKSEYFEVFGNKRKLEYMDLRDNIYNNNIGLIKHNWSLSNLININYESLSNKLHVLNELIDDKTMIVFDEVHRIKSVNGARARSALELSKKTKYRYVLTGTPIPNNFQDIYNFLHLMYPNEYSSFFRWDLNELKNISTDSVNQKLFPFFWRTNKMDLKVPKPDSDNIIKVEPSKNQKLLAKNIYDKENNPLTLFIRLLQASTNPELLKHNINYYDLGLVDDEDDSISYNKDFNPKKYKNYNLDDINTPKFNSGISLIKKLVSQGKKVLVWGIFVGTMNKIYSALNDNNISSLMIYGGTPKDEREKLINEFKNGNVSVLISNPNTLGESVSLHQTTHDAVYFEYNFNLTFMLQSRDRINRLGLKSDQYTRYYYLMSNGDRSHNGFIDNMVYNRLKDKEKIMLNAIEGDFLVPEYTDDYINDVKKIIKDDF